MKMTYYFLLLLAAGVFAILHGCAGDSGSATSPVTTHTIYGTSS